MLGREEATGKVLLHEIHLALLPKQTRNHSDHGPGRPHSVVKGEDTSPSQSRPRESSDGGGVELTTLSFPANTGPLGCSSTAISASLKGSPGY